LKTRLNRFPYQSWSADYVSGAQVLGEHYFRNIIVLNQSLSEEGEAFRESHVPTVGAERAKDHAILWIASLCSALTLSVAWQSPQNFSPGSLGALQEGHTWFPWNSPGRTTIQAYGLLRR
jgi:hypothetical protein